MSRLSVLSVIGTICALIALPAIAQLPIPKQVPPTVPQAAPQQTPRTAAPQVQDFDKLQDPSVSGNYIDDDGIEREPYGNPKLSPEDEAEVQREHAALRQEDVRMGGFNWMPWDKAGPKVWEMVYKKSPQWKEYIEGGLHKYVDIGIYDIDHDKNPDVIAWFWLNCPADGCLYLIHFGNDLKKPDSYVANRLRPYENGIMVDDGYYGY